MSKAAESLGSPDVRSLRLSVADVFLDRHGSLQTVNHNHDRPLRRYILPGDAEAELRAVDLAPLRKSSPACQGHKSF